MKASASSVRDMTQCCQVSGSQHFKWMCPFIFKGSRSYPAIQGNIPQDQIQQYTVLIQVCWLMNHADRSWKFVLHIPDGQNCNNCSLASFFVLFGNFSLQLLKTPISQFVYRIWKIISMNTSYIVTSFVIRYFVSPSLFRVTSDLWTYSRPSMSWLQCCVSCTIVSSVLCLRTSRTKGLSLFIVLYCI